MENRIIECITNYDNTSFSDLSKHVEGFDGNFTLRDSNNEGVVFWNNISQEAAEVICKLIDDGKIKMIPTEIITYMIDGLYPKMPLAKKLRSYASDHFYPVIFTLIK